MLVEIYVSPTVEMSAARSVTEDQVIAGIAELEAKLDAAFIALLTNALESRLPSPVVSWHIHDRGDPMVYGRENANRRWDVTYVAPKVVATVDIPGEAVAAAWLQYFRGWAGDVRGHMNDRLPDGVRVDRIRWREKGGTQLGGTD